MADTDLDKIKNRLRINDLDEGSKKELFQTFVEAGGEVIDYDKQKNRYQAVTGTPRKPALSARDADGLEESPSRGQGKIKKRSSISIQESMKVNPVSRWMERFSAKLGCMFSGVTNLGVNRFKKAFSDLLLEKYQNALLEIQMVLASVLHQNSMVVEQIKQKLSSDPTFPYMYEVLVRMDELYNQEQFNRLMVMHNDPAVVDDLKEELIHIYKGLFILKPHFEMLKLAVERALNLERDLRRMDPNVTFNNYRKVAAYLDLVFLKVYPKLFSLIDFYYKMDTFQRPQRFQNYIGLVEEDHLGFLTKRWQDEIEYLAQKERIKDDLNRSPQPAAGEVPVEHKQAMEDSLPLNKGIDFIREHVDFAQLLTHYREQKDLRALFSINDKVFLTYALVDYYDKEFSFLFNSSKVQFNVAFNYGNRLDMKKELSDCYYKLNSVYERVNEYLKIMREIRKMDKDSYISYEEKASRLNQYSAQRSQISRKMRKEAQNLFETFIKTLLFVITDYNGAKTLMQNPDDPLEFNKKLDGNRIAHGKKAIEAITEAYNMGFAINYLLTDGDLGGYSVLLNNPIMLKIPVE